MVAAFATLIYTSWRNGRRGNLNALHVQMSVWECGLCAHRKASHIRLLSTGQAGPVAPARGATCASLCFAPMAGYGRRARAIGSAGERLVHTEEVTGSIPVSPTRNRRSEQCRQDRYLSKIIRGPFAQKVPGSDTTR
jgi:hypothetical protein